MFIESLTEGSEFTGFYALSRCSLRESNGSYRLEVELSDRTGSLPGVAWDDAQQLYSELKTGDPVKVRGRVGAYQGQPQVTVHQIRKAGDGEFEPDSFIPCTPADISAMQERVRAYVGGIRDKHLAELARRVFDNTVFMEKYSRAPGGKLWHHRYLGGLLEHSLGVTDICDFVAGQHPELNRDLLVVAGLLHDVGKIREFDVTTVIEYSDEGRLEGHIVMGERFVRHYCDAIEGFPPRLKMLLSHLMLAHQGHKEYSSPVEPMTGEAFVLYFADEMDSKLNAVKRISDRAADEGRTWSEYVKILGRYLYVDPDRSRAQDDA